MLRKSRPFWSVLSDYGLFNCVIRVPITFPPEKLHGVRDMNGQTVIRNVYRSSEIYSGNATALAPDLIIGYSRGYRASWETCLGELTPDVLSDNTSAWAADHCADALEVPGVLFCNKPIDKPDPSLVDIASGILHEFGLPTPSTMTGKSLFRP